MGFLSKAKVETGSDTGGVEAGTCDPSDLPIDDTIVMYAVLVSCLVFLTGCLVTRWYYRNVLSVGEHPDKRFVNGVSYMLVVTIILQGANFQTMVRVIAARCRHRLYVGFKKYLFFGDEIWFVGHPALLKQGFDPVNQKLWFKLTKEEVNHTFHQKDEISRTGMLYTGDDARWRNARAALTPYFYNFDFSVIQDQIDTVVVKHLDKLLEQKGGKGELLELFLFITIDLLCAVLYGCELPDGELKILVDSLGEYTVPGTKQTRIYPGNLDAFQYHTKVANAMAKNAPKDTVAHILLHDCPNMSQELKEENIAFFMEALTPAFASFWTVSNVCASAKELKMKSRCMDDDVYRQQCIKESLRMYPPVPMLWLREAKVDQELENPLYDPAAYPKKRSIFSKLFGQVPLEEQEKIKIKKGTKLLVFPAVIHYDDRFWLRPTDFLPERWDRNPDILHGAKVNVRSQKSQWGGLNISRKDLKSGNVAETLDKETAEERVKRSLRSKIFSVEKELEAREVARDHLFEVTRTKEGKGLQAWTFLPFGLGQHTCLGRRLAIQMVDSIVLNALEYGIDFDNGVIPSMFTRKPWHERLNAVTGVYYYPGDPIDVTLKSKEARVVREHRKSYFVQPLEAATTNVPDLAPESEKKEGKRDAVLFINCQNEFVHPNGKLYNSVKEVMEKVGTCENILKLADAAREVDALIIHSPVSLPPGGKFNESDYDSIGHAKVEGLFTEDTWNSEFADDMGFCEGEEVMVGRQDFNAFHGTELKQLLKENNVGRLFIAGFTANASMEETSRTASLELNLDVFPVKDATAASSMKEYTNAVEQAMKVFSKPVTCDNAIKMLDAE